MTKPDAVILGIAIFVSVLALALFTFSMDAPMPFFAGLLFGTWVLAPVLRWVERA